MTEDEKLSLSLSEKLLKLMLNEKIPFEKKKGTMDYLIRVGADVNANVYGKSMAYWVKELGDENLIKYVKERGGVENQISKKESEELGKQFWNKNGEVKSFKEIKELVLMGADLSVKNNNDVQIWKYLSLEEMNEVLKDLPRGYVIDGDVNLRNKGLTNLPDFSKIKVVGDFDCRWNQLTTLQGAPEKVGGSFNCSENQLTSLEGAPSVVGGGFYCRENQLTTLKGAPEKVGRGFDCSENQLTDLKGAPEKVGGDFNCSENQLTTLQGAPNKVGSDFNCRENQLTSLEGAPSEVRGGFYCSENQLTTLQGAPSEVGLNFNCDKNQLTTLEGAPREVGWWFNCENNQLTDLKGKPEKIGGEFEIEEEVLARIKEAEKKKKSDNAMVGFIGNKFEM